MLVFSNISAAAIQGFFWIYLAKILEKPQYGELGYLLSLASLFSSIALVGLPTLIVIYGAKKENVSSPSYTLALITMSITSIAAFLITKNIFVSVLIFGTVLISLFEAELNSKKRYKAYSINNITKRIIVVIFALLFYPFFGINGILIGFFISTLSGSIGFYNYLKNKKIRISALKPKLRFLINDYFSGVMGTILFTGDKLIIGSLASFTLLGNYQLSIQPLIVLQVIPSALLTYLMPREAQGIRDIRYKIYSILLISAISVISIGLAPYAVDTFLPKYHEVISAIQLMIISIIPSTANMIFAAEFYAKEKSKIVLTSSVLQVCLYFVLIPILGTSWLGLVGISIAYLISATGVSVYSVIMRHKIINS